MRRWYLQDRRLPSSRLGRNQTWPLAWHSTSTTTSGEPTMCSGPRTQTRNHTCASAFSFKLQSQKRMSRQDRSGSLQQAILAWLRGAFEVGTACGHTSRHAKVHNQAIISRASQASVHVEWRAVLACRAHSVFGALRNDGDCMYYCRTPVSVQRSALERQIHRWNVQLRSTGKLL